MKLLNWLDDWLWLCSLIKRSRVWVSPAVLSSIWPWSSHSRTPASVTKQYDLVLVDRWWFSEARKITRGLSLHWPTSWNLCCIYVWAQRSKTGRRVVYGPVDYGTFYCCICLLPSMSVGNWSDNTAIAVIVCVGCSGRTKNLWALFRLPNHLRQETSLRSRWRKTQRRWIQCDSQPTIVPTYSQRHSDFDICLLNGSTAPSRYDSVTAARVAVPVCVWCQYRHIGGLLIILLLHKLIICIVIDAAQEDCARLTLVHLLSVGRASTSVTELSMQLDLESGTICRWTSDSRTCHTAVSDLRQMLSLKTLLLHYFYNVLSSLSFWPMRETFCVL